MKKSRNWRQKKADALFQQMRVGKKCEVCGKPAQVVHHFVPKSVSNRLRYDTKNGIILCNGCHMRHHQAGDPLIHLTVEEKRGKGWVDYIKKARYETVKVDVGFYEEAIKRLTNTKT